MNPEVTAFKSGSKIDWLEFTVWNWPLTPKQFHDRNRPLTIFEKARVEFGMDEIEELKPGKQPWTVEEVQDLAGLSGLPLVKLPKGMHGYKDQHLAGLGRILSNGNADMGIHCILSGEALDMCSPPDKIIKTAIGGLGRMSRIDLAFDDFDGKLNLKKIIKQARNCGLITRAREGSVWESFNLKSGEITGLTFYVGTRESDHYFRFYDKRLEMIKNGADPAELPKQWVRVEGEFKNDAAVNVAAGIYAGDDIQAVLMEILNNYLSFRDEKGANRSRWPVSQWWADFLETNRRRSVARKLKKGDMETRRKWFAKQAGPSLAMVAECFGADELTEIFKYARRNLADKHITEMENFKKQREQRRTNL